MEPTRVLVVALVRFYRDGVSEHLRTAEGLEVVAAAEDASGAVAAAAAHQPSIVLLDTAVPDAAGTVRALRAAAPGTRVVALDVPNGDDEIIACAEAGFDSYVSRDGTLADVVTTIRSAARGELECSPRTAASLLRRIGALAGTGHLGDEPGVDLRLTAREREIVRLIDDGLSNKQIAGRLCIEVPTVKNHVHHILEKVGARGRAEAAALVRRAELPRL